MKSSLLVRWVAPVLFLLGLNACDEPVKDAGPVPAGQIGTAQLAIINTTGGNSVEIVDGLNTVCDCDTGNPCLIGKCLSGGKCSFTKAADGTACDDGLACTNGDQCSSGTCKGSSTCGAAPDDCHTVQCTANGCSYPAKADNTTCDDGDLCTGASSCQGGACKGSQPVVCTASDQCHVAGSCDPKTGVCSNPAKTDGTGCNDNNPCTKTDSCQAGVCKGGDPVVCTASDQCHGAGTCDPTTGSCSNPVRSGVKCDDGNACSYGDVCADDGKCNGTAIICKSDDFATRTCNGTSTCTVVPKPGAACDDGNPCTKGDVRQADGSCAGMAYRCAVNECLVSSECDGNGGCKEIAKPDGTSCDADKSKCTPHDVCKGGSCVPDPKPVACPTKDCNTAVCDPTSGNCSYKPTSGGKCGLTGCFTEGTCTNGACSGKPKDCSAMNGACADGICDATNGECVAVPKPNGTTCSAGGKCSGSAVCAFGVCELASMTCPKASGPCKVPSCEAATGMCTETNRPAGASCDPGNSCLMQAACDAAGNCLGVPAANGDPCTLPGGQIGRCAAGSCVNLGNPEGTGGSGGRPVDGGAADAPAAGGTGGAGGGGGAGGTAGGAAGATGGGAGASGGAGGGAGGSATTGSGGGCTVGSHDEGAGLTLLLAAVGLVGLSRRRRR